jgi:sarcosine oxidase subunit beta
VVAERGRVRGVRTNGGTASAGSVLICAGAWTQALCETVGVRAPVRPRRGDLLVTEAMPPMVRSVLLHAPYVAGKRGNAGLRPATLVVEQIEEGNLLIGSTRVYAGFEVRVSAEGVAAISEEAQRLAPGLRRLHVIRAFGGLRPCSGDGLPLVGPVSRVEGLHVAAGHEGDGVALAPVTGQLVADGMLGGAWLPALRVERPAAEPR